MKIDGETLWTTRELARFLRQNPISVYKKSKRGLIPGRIKLGGIVRYKESAIREWIENRTAKDGK